MCGGLAIHRAGQRDAFKEENRQNDVGERCGEVPLQSIMTHNHVKTCCGEVPCNELSIPE